MPQHVREEEKHDGSVHELVQKGSEQRRAARVAVAVRDHPHTKHGAPAEHEADGDEDVEGVHQELKCCGEHDPHLAKQSIGRQEQQQ